MFYDRFIELCKERNVSPSAVMVAIGLNKSNATFWKKGSMPKGETIQKLANYFGVSAQALLPVVYPPINDDLAQTLLSGSTGENIRLLRKENKIGQSELADRSGIPVRYIRSFEKEDGVYFPTEDDLDRLSAVFQIEPRYIQGTGVTQEWLLAALYSKPLQEKMDQAMRKLNIEGQEEAVKRVEELTEIPRYQAKGGN